MFLALVTVSEDPRNRGRHGAIRRVSLAPIGCRGLEYAPMKTIAIIGAGGNARELAGIIRDLGCYTFLGFLADRQGKYDSPILGSFEWLCSNEVDCLAMGIGSPAHKLTIGRKLAEQFPRIKWPVLIHPSAYLGPTCSLSPGVIVGVRAIATEHVRIGDLLNSTLVAR